MKKIIFIALMVTIGFLAAGQDAKPAPREAKYFLDVHNAEPGKLTDAAVAEAHKKDLAVEDQFGVKFLRYWVDSKEGKIYCLSQAADPQSVSMTHMNAHGMNFDNIAQVIPGKEANLVAGKELFLDIHEIGPGKVAAAAVEEAHQKDLAKQASNGVNFINYWVDEKNGVIYCLSQAPNEEAVKATHKAAHGMLPTKIYQVTQGQ
jgi:hypothetical protein